MPVAPAAVEVLRALLGVLPRWGEWYLFGAQAVVAYGVPRLSADVDIPTLEPGDLIIAKILAGRPKDLEDARGLVRAKAEELDTARIESVLQLLEQALSQSDLLPVWSAIRPRG